MRLSSSLAAAITLTHAICATAEPTLTVPDGFSITRVAGPPMVDRPICADFDDRGRLYVADSSGSNEKVEVQLEKKPHRILRLEDTDGDGVFDKRTVFADRMMFPEGILWHDGAVYCGAPPSIWKLEDRDDDGIAEKRTEWFQGKTLTGCANDLHGPYLGPDGYIYWCKGAFAQQHHERPGRKPVSDKAAHIFRCRPDGSDFDSFMSGGMDNPVEVAWTPEGDLFFTTTFYTNPRGGQRDAIVHAIYGGVYPKVHGVLDGLVRTGALMPAMTHLGPAAPCGLTRYHSGVFGPEYRDNLFCCQFNTHKVTRHILEGHGSTYRTIDSDFVTSDSPDFHPTDVLVDRKDGSLLVIDTGGWYKLCCPTSQIAKPEVLGAIYRVRPDPAIPPTALHLLADMEPGIAEVWLRCRRDGQGDRAAIRAALSNTDPRILRAAIHAVGMLRDTGALDGLLPLLEHESPHVRRAAATTCGHLRDRKAVPALLHSAARAIDRPLEHAIIHSLIEIGDGGETAKGLGADDPKIRRAALIALDQIEDGGAPVDALLACLKSDERTVADAAWWIYEQRPGRAGELLEFFRAAPPGEELLPRLGTYVSNGKLRPIVVEAIGASIRSKDDERVRLAIGLARKTGDRKTFESSLSAIAGDPNRSRSIRLDALSALAPLPSPLDSDRFAFLKGALPDLRAATILEKTGLDHDQLLALTGAVRDAGPVELPHLLGAFLAGGDDTLGLQLANALGANPGLASLDRKTLTSAFAKFDQAHLERLLARLAASRPPDEAAHLERVAAELAELGKGDPARGHLVFNSNAAACLSCHVIGYRGGDLGPGLSRIGGIRTERDLLEALLFPGASFVRSYEPVMVKTKAGSQLTGIVRSQNDESVTLAIGPGVTRTLARNDIGALIPGAVSLMPPALDQRISRRQLADLLAFLKSLR